MGSLYWRQFMLSAGMVLLTMVLLGVSFYALSYNYTVSEKRGEMRDRANLIAQLSVTYLVAGGETETTQEDALRALAGVASRMTDVDFLICNKAGDVLLTSDDLLSWKFLQEISLPGDAECPDLYPLYLDNDRSKKRWVLSGASDRFLIGEVKNGRFRPSGPPQRLHYGSNSYAAQTFSDIPEADGRRLRIAWNTTAVPQSCFGGSMCLPCEMRLQTIRQEEVVTTWPIAEISALFTGRKAHLLEELSAGSSCLIDRLTPGAAWMEFFVTPSEDSVFEWTVFGAGVEVNVPENIVRCMDKSMPLHLEDGRLHLLVIADTLGFEIFGGRGQSFMCMGFPADFNLNGLELSVQRGGLSRMECTLCGLKNIWRSDDR